MNLRDQLQYKVNKIEELYSMRNTQEFISHRFSINIDDVGRATRILDFANTRKKNIFNLKKGEMLKPCYSIDEFEFLDKYPLENFD